MPKRTRFASMAAALLMGASLMPGVAEQAPVTARLAGLYAVPAVHALPTGLASPSQPPTASLCEAYYDVTCYDPAQLEAAYGTDAVYEDGVTGAGETIAVVEPFGSPTIEQDLDAFDQAFGLPNPPSFQIVAPAGAPPAYTGTPVEQAWAEETSLDVEWAHAIAPGASILLVETPVDETEGLAGFPQILSSEAWVIDRGLADVISQSFEATEETFGSASLLRLLSATYFDAYVHHVTVVSASGDNGVAGYADPSTTTFFPFRVVQWPASDPLVTAVGGTAVNLDAAGDRLSPDTAWNDTYNATVLRDFAGTVPPEPFASSGGRSAVFFRPAYQHRVADVTGDRRGVPDISMNAACTGPVDIYSAAVGGWLITCGTSEAAPLFAGVVALADQWAGRDMGLVNPALYRLGAKDAAGIVPIYQGNNTVSFPLTQTATTLTGDSTTLTADASTFGAMAASDLTGNAATLSADAGTLTGEAGTITLPGYSANAGGGYNLVTGLGTVDAAQLVPELAKKGAPLTWGQGPTGPSARSYPAMATDPSGETLLFGGVGPSNTYLGGTWALSTAHYSWQDLSAGSAAAPSPRAGANLVWDEAFSEFVLFGGVNSTGFQDDTWAFNPVSGQWSRLSPAATPTPRAIAAMTALPDGDIVLFGGLTYTGYLADTWVYSPAANTWSKVATSGPSARWGAAMATDASSGTAVLFGGGGHAGFDSDTWLYDPASGAWSQLATTGTVPSARAGAGLVYDTAARVFVLADGGTTKGYSNETYTFDPATLTWSQLSPDASPAPRVEAGLSYDPSTGTLVQFGGYSAAGYQADTWELGGQLPEAFARGLGRASLAGVCRGYLLASRCLSRRST